MSTGEKMEIEIIKLKELKQYENNAKIHTEKQIEHIINSINKFGFNDPIAVWGKENLIIEGHGRYLALKKMGAKEVEIIRLDHLSEDERKAYTLAHNQLNLETGFDFDILERELAELEDMDMDMFGFDLEDLKEEEPYQGENQEEEPETEIPEEKFGEELFENECPKCGFEFN